MSKYVAVLQRSMLFLTCGMLIQDSVYVDYVSTLELFLSSV